MAWPTSRRSQFPLYSLRKLVQFGEPWRTLRRLDSMNRRTPANVHVRWTRGFQSARNGVPSLQGPCPRRTAAPVANDTNWRHSAAFSEFVSSFLNGLQRSVNRKVQSSNLCPGARFLELDRVAYRFPLGGGLQQPCSYRTATPNSCRGSRSVDVNSKASPDAVPGTRACGAKPQGA